MARIAFNGYRNGLVVMIAMGLAGAVALALAQRISLKPDAISGQ
jgi:hypothetical protein